ncbi:oligosaccharide flippase family protein [Clostridium perfringens]|uniref:Oligosaccharide flippase family protein n=1 Tax=Clostridium perfringens TaxID=1502 RepID=A0AAW9IH96_CLOPF|nr:oligosaccharide flippase family protein [Clostridium perfringens]MDZ5000036.1 oligosaccharide flippase family protein [Clostridium perfringens]
MRTKKATINTIVNIILYIIAFLPSFLVRKVFLDKLGGELLGLSSLYGNIIGVLSMVELGIGSAIVFALYKPFSNNDRVKIKGYLNYYAKFYRIVGFTILLIGIFIIPFLNIFIKNSINIIDARIYFVLFLINTFISYLFSYKICILNVAQENYKISGATTISKLCISILQVFSLKFHPSFYTFIVIQIVVNLVYYIILNRYIDNKFKWLKTTKGNITNEEKHSLIKNVKALFLHKIGGMLVFGVDNIVISSFVNLDVVGRFNSYNMIIGVIQGGVGNAVDGVTASVGNLLAEGNEENSYMVHKRLFFLNFWVVSFIVISLYNTLEQFIIIWLGKDQILDRFTLILMLSNLYFLLMRSSVEMFKSGAGIYHQDRFAPILEGGINLVSSIVLVKFIGLPGVVLGTLISNLTVIFWLKPKMVYKYVFNKPLKEYFFMYFKYLLIGLIPLIITKYLTIKLRNSQLLIGFIENCIVNIVVINSLYMVIFRKNENFKYFKEVIKNILRINN